MGIIGPTAPSGPAGGSLAGTYPNPTLGVGSINAANLFTAGVVAGSTLAGNNAVPAFGVNGELKQQAQQNACKKNVASIVGDGVKNEWEYVVAEQTALITLIYKVGTSQYLSPIGAEGYEVKESAGKTKIKFTKAPAAAEQFLIITIW